MSKSSYFIVRFDYDNWEFCVDQEMASEILPGAMYDDEKGEWYTPDDGSDDFQDDSTMLDELMFRVAR